MPTLYIIAGCNGAGKTTVAYNLLPEVFQTVEFINADEIARGISPFNVEGVAFQAGRIMLERMGQLINERKSFAFETTLSGLGHLKFIKSAKLLSYDIILCFIWLNSLDLAKNRVAVRVTKGGHNIPENVIVRRYVKGLQNFAKYANETDDWYIYDNSGNQYLLVAKNIGGNQEIFNFEVYNKIMKG